MVIMPRRGENIYKRKDGRWEARYVKEVAPDGRKRYGSVYARSYSDVKQKQAEMLHSPPKPSDFTQPMSIEDAYLLWLARLRTNAKPNTVSKYEGIYKNHIFALRKMKIEDVDRFAISQFTASLQRKGLANKTVNDILVVLNLILKQGEELTGCTCPKIIHMREPRSEIRFLTPREQKRLSEYLADDIDIHKFGTLLALYTGIRLGELCALRWEDIDECSININSTMMRVNDGGVTRVITAPPKSESSARLIPIPAFLLPYITEFKDSGYVLSTHKLRFTEPRLMQFKFKKYAADCELQNVTFHTLRHTFATRCIEAGVDAKTVSELLGHADTKITLNRYVHPSFELKQKSIDKLQDIVF